MKNFGPLEIALVAAVVILAVLLFANRGCTTCKNRLAQIQGVFPGAGTGVMVRPEQAAAGAE